MMFDAVAADGRREFMTAGQEGVVRLWDIANIGMCCKSIVAIYNPHKSTSLWVGVVDGLISATGLLWTVMLMIMMLIAIAWVNDNFDDYDYDDNGDDDDENDYVADDDDDNDDDDNDDDDDDNDDDDATQCTSI